MAKLLKDSKKGLVQRSSLLHIAAMTLADHMKSGTFKSLYRGQGIEFCDETLHAFVTDPVGGIIVAYAYNGIPRGG